MVTSETDVTRLVSVAERWDLAEEVLALLQSRWPRFMLEGHGDEDVDLPQLLMQVPEFQMLLVDDQGLVGAGLSVPVKWDGTVPGLPAGWDGALIDSADLVARGEQPTALCGLSITLRAGEAGRRLSMRLIEGLKDAAVNAGMRSVIIPVRPTHKVRYPLIPLAEYLTWRAEDGAAFDPWMRIHLDAGATVLGVADPAMRITGSVGEWEEWTGLPMPGSGTYIIPGGIAPLRIDREADRGVYTEENAWVSYQLGARQNRT